MMTNTRHVMKWLITATLAALCSLGVGLAAQTAPSSTQTSPSSTQTAPASTQTAPAQTPSQKGDDDTTRAQIARFDQFLDNHPETAEQLRKNPSLVNNEEFVEKHPALQQYLQQNPGVREELSENPNRFMQQEQRFDRREDDQARRRELRNLDNFLDTHPEIAEQVQKNPALFNDKGFVKKHQSLEEFLEQNPGVRDQLKVHPDAFMQQEQRFDQRENRTDADMGRGPIAGFDRFLDSHPEIAEQVRKDPSLLKNEEFGEKHPALKEFLQQNPGVREEISENPNTFMQQEQRFDRREGIDGDRDRVGVAGFGAFLGSHSGIAQQLSKNPSLAKNEEYVESHPELQAYLQAHPELQEQLQQHPQEVIQSAQQQSGVKANSTMMTGKKAGQTEPKPKQ